MTQPSQREWAQATTARRTLGGLARVVSLLALVATLAACGASRPASDRAAAPDFSLAAFDGRTVNLAELRGQAVVLNF